METSLHRALKTLYAGRGARLEVPVDGYRVDVVCEDRLIEIQHGPLSAIREKVARLLKRHEVLVVKPIVVRKLLIKRAGKGGQVVGRRRSPKRGRLLDLFDDLVHFTRVFPHRRLTLEVPLVEVEQWRYPIRQRRHGSRGYLIEDQKLQAVGAIHRFRTAADLLEMLPQPLPGAFHTGHLARSLGVDRWVAQRIAYCLRQMGAFRQVGKEGNAWIYRLATGRPAKTGKRAA